MGKDIDIQQNHVIVPESEAPSAGHVAFFAKEDGLYERLPGEPAVERKLYGGGSSIILPQLTLKGFNFRPAGGQFAVRDKLFAKWQSENIAFLDYNPEIWIFRRNAYKRRKWDDVVGEYEHHRGKKWKHEPHLNGIKFPGSRYYAGTTRSPIISVSTNGRHTEFELTAGKDEYQEVGLNIYEFLRTTDSLGNILTDESDFTVIDGIQFCATKRYLQLRLAIVIDNPDAAADNPKLIGPLSDILLVRPHPVWDYSNPEPIRYWRFVYANYTMWIDL